MKNIISDYIDYYNKTWKRKDLYKEVAHKYNVKTALYPGSHIDITPSLFIPCITYIDSFKGAIKFFYNMDIIKEYIDENKIYEEDVLIDFIGDDYSNPQNIEEVELIISQFAGFVGQATKKYLKVGGILLCNDSHADATLAKYDEDYELVGVVDNSGIISEDNSDLYFKLPRQREVDLDKVKSEMKGPKYTLRADNYIFRKIR